jgi:hypothetical protein
MLAMSSSRMLLATPVTGFTARIGKRLSASSDWNCPSMRTASRSVDVFSAPAPSTAFCAFIWASTWFMSMPSCASRFCEISTNTRSACTPYSCTLATSGTRSSFSRTRSACWRNSSGLKPSADSAKIEPKTSPKSSLKPGPMTPAGSELRMSPMRLRAW